MLVCFHPLLCNRSRKQLVNAQFKIGDQTPTIKWADPKTDDRTSDRTIKTIYIGNLPTNVTEDELKSLCAKYGKVVRISKPNLKRGKEKQYAFVEFQDRYAIQRPG